MKHLIYLACFLVGVHSYKILGLFPHPGKSHQDVFDPLLVELVERGHNLTIVSHFEPPLQLDRWTHIPMGVYSDFHKEALDMTMFRERIFGIDRFFHIRDSQMLFSIALTMCDALTKIPQIHEYIITGEKFDLILVEQFTSDCALGVAYFFDAPVVALQSHPPMPWTLRRFGQPNNPSYMPCIFLRHGPHMNFLERMENTFFDVVIAMLYEYSVFIPERDIVQNNLNRTIPPLSEIAQNTSAILVNTHFTSHGAKPLVPSVVEIGGMHVRKTLKPLSQEIEKYMNESEHGVIIFSMGSMLRTSTIAPEKRDAFVDAFSKLKQNVIWKWEGEPIPGLSKNVLVLRWLPQLELLHHPKTVAFISHGGLLGTTEALHAGVPMLFIPVFADQGTNSAAAVESGLGLRVSYAEVTKERIYDALQNVLSPEMRESAKKLSEQWHDRVPPLKLAADTVEYVAKYKGKHLRSAAQDLSTFQLYLMDVYLFFVAILVLLLLMIFISLRSIFRYIFRGQQTQPSITKYKQN